MFCYLDSNKEKHLSSKQYFKHLMSFTFYQDPLDEPLENDLLLSLAFQHVFSA